MNYNKLRLNLEKYGRDTNFAYVNGHFKPELRSNKKFKQWQRLLEKTTIKSLSAKEKRILGLLVEVKLSVFKNLGIIS